MDGPVEPGGIFAACFFFTIGWLMAYVSATRRPDVGMDSLFYRTIYKWTDDQINANHRFGAVFAGLIGTMAPLMILIRSHAGRKICLVFFLLLLLSSPFVLYWWKPPKPHPDDRATLRGFLRKKPARIVSIITLGIAIIQPILVYQNGGSMTFALVGFAMMFTVPAFYYFISLY